MLWRGATIGRLSRAAASSGLATILAQFACLTHKRRPFTERRKCLSQLMMPKARLELARAGARQILSLLRLPIPPLGRVIAKHNQGRNC